MSLLRAREEFTEPVSTDFTHPELERIRRGLAEFVVNQQRATAQMLNGLAIYFSGLQREKGVAGAYLFAGPSGSGKTYAGEILSWLFLNQAVTYGDPPATVIKCAELSQEHEISKLLGAAPGYAGYYKHDDPHGAAGAVPRLSQPEIDMHDTDREKAAQRLRAIVQGYITKLNTVIDKEDMTAVEEEQRKMIAGIDARARLRSVIIFDELERAAKTTRDLLLHILEDGTIRMASGATTDFRNSIIVMTSNVGEYRLSQYLRGGHQRSMGFVRSSPSREKVDKDIYDIVFDEARKVFPPGLLGRIGSGFVAFRPLTKEHVHQILGLLLARLQKRFDGSDTYYPPIILAYDDAVKTWLVEHGSDPEYGARDLRKKVDTHIMSQLAKALLAHDLMPGDEILFVLENGEPRMRRVPRTTPNPPRISIPDADTEKPHADEEQALRKLLEEMLKRYQEKKHRRDAERRNRRYPPPQTPDGARPNDPSVM